MTHNCKIGIQGQGDIMFEQPILNRLKLCDSFSAKRHSTGTQVGLLTPNVDFNANSNGYPTDMNGIGPTYGGDTFDNFNFVMMKSCASPLFYRSGHWTVLWQGTATASSFTLTEDFAGAAWPVISSSNPSGTTPGRKEVNVTASTTGGLGLQISGISGGATVTDIAIVPTIYEAQYLAGEVVDPDWFTKFGTFQAFRNMQMQGVFGNNGSLGYWAQDPAYIFWARQVPTEWFVSACNKMGAQLYMCTSALCRNDDVIECADRVLNGHTDSSPTPAIVTNGPRTWPGLNSNLNVYVEFINEQFDFPQGTAEWNGMVANGAIMFPTLIGVDNNLVRAYYYCRSAQVGSVWQDRWNQSGQASRVKRIQGAQLNGADLNLQNTASLFVGAFASGAASWSAQASISGTTLTIVSGFSGTILPGTSVNGAGNNIAVQAVTGTGCLPQTYIVSNISGSGNGSTWVVSKNHPTPTGTQSMTGQYFTGAVSDNVDLINQAPYWSTFSVPTNMADIWTQATGLTQTFVGGITSNVLTVTTALPSGNYIVAGAQLLGGGSTATVLSQLTNTESGPFPNWGQKGTYQLTSGPNVANGTTLTMNNGTVYFSTAVAAAQRLNARNNYGNTGINRSAPLDCVLYEFGWSFAGFLSAVVKGSANNGSGLIRIELIDPGYANFVFTGDTVNFVNVDSTVNGQWTVTAVDQTHFDLQGSTFTSGFGPSFLPSVFNNTRQALFVSTKSDPNVYTSYLYQLSLFEANSIPLACHYASVSPFTFAINSAFTDWGCIPNILTPTSDSSAQEYNALMAFIGTEPTPTPDTGGTTQGRVWASSLEIPVRLSRVLG